eukprot:Rmarinus@m.13183
MVDDNSSNVIQTCSLENHSVSVKVVDFEKSDLPAIVALDELMAHELDGGGDAYGVAWFNAHCLPDRPVFRNFRTITAVESFLSAAGDLDDNCVCIDAEGGNDDNRGGDGNCDGLRGSPTSGCRGKAKRNPLGFCIYSLESYMKSRRRKSWFVELFWVVVSKASRGKGVGRALLTAAAKRARLEWPQADSMRLHVLSTNTAAVLLYKKLGYTVTATKQNYPVQGSSSYRMILPLCQGNINGIKAMCRL